MEYVERFPRHICLSLSRTLGAVGTATVGQGHHKERVQVLDIEAFHDPLRIPLTRFPWHDTFLICGEGTPHGAR